MKRVRVQSYPCDHFGICVGEHFERAVRDQLDFLATHFDYAAAKT
ncbi:hypothetical protein J2W56_003430 [Nocardia kruczakiae]|uniref:Uncharacterized protein n=1 Tax=Nocardia kruczakiae TaxID=261477 RepID=A0ABU1XGM9_9NOCA|nr:hypothetical protein [Nocardia kruczakiae]MDR7169686.1 hypothetical protein [Nocardia kruczakiae]